MTNEEEAATHQGESYFRSLAEDLQKRVDERTEEIEGIATILSDFVESGDFRAASQKLLHLALRKTESSYGFIGAVVPGGPQGQILRVFADEGFNWDPEVNRDLYEKIVSDYQTRGGIDFPLLDNLFGWCIVNAEAIIANDPLHDERRSGRIPPGHPPMDSFLGVPIQKGEAVVGMFGVANRPGGYTEEQAKALGTLARTASVIYESYKRLQHEHSLLQDRTQTEEKLKQSNQQLLDLAYVVSHELQEPLRTIRSELSLLSVRYSDRLGADADGFISNSVRAAGIVDRMVDDLWEYARIDRPHITFQDLDLNEVFNKAMESLSDLIQSKRAVITRGELPNLHGEPRQMGMVFRQLICNAVTYNSSSIPKVEITARQMVNEWLFSVTDNGSGFDPTDSTEIFKMFRKLDRETPGSGMGLAIVKRIVEFHGGRIWAESEKSHGARFHFTLPLVAVR